MLKIVRGDTVLSVTTGAYNEMYKNQGYVVFDGKEIPKTATNIPIKKAQETSPDAEDVLEEYEEYEDSTEEYEEENTGLTDEDLLETPISSLASMDIDNLRRLAVLKGIDTDAYKTKKELRAQIKKVL